jgi:hypothetical protein
MIDGALDAQAQAYAPPLEDSFESGRTIVIDNLFQEQIRFFQELPEVKFPQWQQPLFQRQVLETVTSDHPLLPYYPSQSTISYFAHHAQELLRQLDQLFSRLFPDYVVNLRMLSWRMNTMDKGYLHFDIPESNHPEHQLRLFVNLGRRPRILEFGPCLKGVISLLKEKLELSNLADLQPNDLLNELKYRYLKPMGFEDLHLPRHVLFLAPGSVWIGNAYLQSHGLIYGEKTVCYEVRIRPESLKNPHLNWRDQINQLRDELRSE